MKKFAGVLGAVLCLIFVASVAAAQDYRARVQGSVDDSSGSALPGVTVTLVNTRPASRDARTSGEGHYLFDFVDPGVYTILGELPGLQDGGAAERRACRSAAT